MEDELEQLAAAHINSLLGFNGERIDPVLGNYLLGNGYRMYNPALRRFMSPDSLSPFGAGGINPYAYCEGDPINRTDPTGHWSFLRGIESIGEIGLGLLTDDPELDIEGEMHLGVRDANRTRHDATFAETRGRHRIQGEDEVANRHTAHRRINQRQTFDGIDAEKTSVRQRSSSLSGLSTEGVTEEQIRDLREQHQVQRVSDGLQSVRESLRGGDYTSPLWDDPARARSLFTRYGWSPRVTMSRYGDPVFSLPPLPDRSLFPDTSSTRQDFIAIMEFNVDNSKNDNLLHERHIADLRDELFRRRTRDGRPRL